jgi:ABC-type transport system involved in multi-copper enzyme maturation permease subunit
MSNLVGAVSSQIFVVVAIFAVMSLIVAERESGTLAWTASKPVSRSAIWLAKFIVATAVLWIAAGLVPLTATVAEVVALFGPLPAPAIVIFAIGMGLAIALYVALALALSTVVSSQAAVAGIALGVVFLPQLLGLFIPPQLMPTSILQWTIMAGLGEPAGFVTPIVWLGSMAALVAFSLWRMERLEL